MKKHLRTLGILLIVIGGLVLMGVRNVRAKIAAVTIRPEPTCPRNGAVAEAQFP